MNNQVKLHFFASTPEPCSYLNNRNTVSAFANPNADMDMDTYNELIQKGFRRSGSYVYRPYCPGCQECISVRIPAQRHCLSRSEQRAIRRNADLVVSTTKDKFCEEHFALYQRYMSNRHSDSNMTNPCRSDYRRFLICDWSETLFFEYRKNRNLVAVAVVDVVDTGLSAVYTFFDPDLSARSLGHFAILNLLKEARARGLEYLYLGYWIKNSRKMGYKRRYQPLEAYIDDQWVVLPPKQ